MHEHTIDQLLSSAEVFHYARKYRGQTFTAILEDSNKLEDIIEDLRLLDLANIHIVVCVKNARRLATRTRRLNKLGVRIQYRDLKDLNYLPVRGPLDTIEILEFSDLRLAEDEFLDAVMNLTNKLDASKFYYLGEQPGLKIDGKLKPNCTNAELDKLLAGGEKFNLERRFLEFISQRVEDDLDFIVLSCQMGSLFQEIFTHYGAGTLFSDREVSKLRKARPEDTMDIFWLMKPYIANSLILPVTDDEILATIDSYIVLTVDQALVACAKLTDYGEACEFAKLCALPRYRGRGQARTMIRRLIKEAAGRKKEYVFALSISESVGELFMSLGFCEVSRDSLPNKWKDSYDLNRPSKAFRYDIV